MPPEVTEPQTLDDVMDSAMSPEQGEAEAPEQEVQETTPAPEQQVSQEESYTRIDPKTLPPELQAMHKSLLRDYTKKTQELAKQRKEIESMRTQPQAEQRQDFQPAQPQTVPQVPSENMTVDEYTAFMLSKMEEKLTEQQERMLAEQNEKYLAKAVQEFEATDERLNPLAPGYDEYMRNAVGSKLDEALSAYTAENGSPIGFDYQAQTEQLIEQYEKHIEERAKAIAAQRTQQAFKGAKRTAPTSAVSSQAPSKSVGKMSLDEAIDSAFTE